MNIEGLGEKIMEDFLKTLEQDVNSWLQDKWLKTNFTRNL